MSDSIIEKTKADLERMELDRHSLAWSLSHDKGSQARAKQVLDHVYGVSFVAGMLYGARMCDNDHR